MKKTRALVYVALFAALIAAGAFLQVPVPPVPFTLQSFFCLLAGSLLGPWLGTLSVLIYLAAGLIGLPVFTQGGGFSYLFMPTFGFLLGLIPTALLSGLFMRRAAGLKGAGGTAARAALLFACSALLLLLGFFYYVLLNQVPGADLWGVFVSFVLLFLPAEAVKAAAASVLFGALGRYFPESLGQMKGMRQLQKAEKGPHRQEEESTAVKEDR